LGVYVGVISPIGQKGEIKRTPHAPKSKVKKGERPRRVSRAQGIPEAEDVKRGGKPAKKKGSGDT